MKWMSEWHITYNFPRLIMRLPAACLIWISAWWWWFQSLWTPLVIMAGHPVLAGGHPTPALA